MQIRTRSTAGIVLAGVLASAFFTGCSTTPTQDEDIIEPMHPVSEIVKDDVTYAFDVYDPWEGFNRSIYNFNAQFDEAIFLPVVSGYQAVTPQVVQTGVTNFFNNLEDLQTLVNAVLQFKPRVSLETATRLVWNTTAGLLGVIDVASVMEIRRHDEDFGQTLGHYGVGNGPYLVLPILGPSNLRDTAGLAVDAVVLDALDPFDFDDHSSRQIPYYLFKAIDARANIGFRYFETGSPFEYDLVRRLYTTKRELEIAK